MNPFEQFPAWLAEEWRRRLMQSIEAMAGESVAMEQQEIRATREEASLGVLYPVSAGAGCSLWAGALGNAWEVIGQRAAEAAGIAPAGPEEIRNTYLEIVTQACAGVAQAIGERLGQEVTLGEQTLSEKPPAGALTLRFAVRFPGLNSVVVCLGVSAGLNALLNQTSRPAAGGADLVPEAAESSGSKTLDLLLEVELPVSVSFGRTEIPLKDVLKLSTGSILELNRAVSEPVEIIVNNCVIARGEVVVIEGNYGVRVTQVISRQERLRTLY
jgi:flagellar motor switch protein FliN/FliY